MAEGALRVVTLADELDAAFAKAGHTFADGSPRRIGMIDIGGGLSANYASDEVNPSFGDYAAQLRLSCPQIFDGRRVLVTEFGKAIVAKTAAIFARIEDTLEEPVSAAAAAAAAAEPGKRPHLTAIAHAGADLLLRTAYCPDKFAHRVMILDPTGAVKSSADGPTTGQQGGGQGVCCTTVAGPLCFSGDVIASRVQLPLSAPGDWVLVLDAGRTRCPSSAGIARAWPHQWWALGRARLRQEGGQMAQEATCCHI